MAAAVDTAFLATAYSLPETTFTSLIDAPTQQLVLSLLNQLVVAANEFESAKAEKLKTDVELEAAVRVGNSRVKQLKDSNEKNLKAVEALRKQLNESEVARTTIESNLHNLQSSSSNSSSELQALQSRISTLEASNRDVNALLDSKNAAHDNLAEELKAQQQKIIALRREVSELEEKLQKSEQAYNSTKFREQNLQHEIELSKKNNEYLEDEVKRKSADFTKYRKEKTAQIAQLQRANDESLQQVESLKRSETALKNRVNEGIRKLEEAYAKIESLQSDTNSAQESFRLELENAHRLSALQKQSADTARARLQEVTELYERLQDNAADEVGQLQAEADTERAEKEALEQRVMELEAQIEALESEVAESRQNLSTPRRNVNGNGTPATPIRSGSPFATPASSRLKGSLSMTQLYSENTKLRAEIETERQRNEKLRQTIDDMIHDLEQQQPGIEELRLDHARIQSDLEQMSEVLDEATKDRDTTRKDARKLEGQVSGLVKESELLRQEIVDLSMQIKVLLTEAQAREAGMENLTPMDQALLERAARGDMDISELDGMSDTGRLISQRLTVFRNVEQLQDQNAKLLHLTRKLGEEMEGQEAIEKKRQHEQDQEELQELREHNGRLQDEIKSLQVRSESYIRERDMFRRMLGHRGQLPADGNLEAAFGQSTSSFTQSTGPKTDDTQNSKDLADYNRLLKELQSQYDAYRQESAADQTALKDQLNRVSKEKSDLQSEVAKSSSQVTLAGERYELLQSTFNMMRQENTELQKRTSTLADVANKQEIRTQQVAEELVEARSLTDGLRNENANLKAERELWKKIEARLGEDNRQLIEERSRLNKMISDLQSLNNERELADSETRRRLQTRADNLEAELQTTKRKLEDATEEVKNGAQRRDYDNGQNQGRIDDLLKALSNTREELVAAKTTRDQLQARVDELKIDLRNAEEKTIALAPRLTSRPNQPQNQEDQENELSREQELAIQVADLRRDLELTKTEVQQANQHVEQYKQISQEAEDELQSLTNTHDEFREEMDRIVAEKETKVQDLEKRVEEISSELATTSAELSELRTKQDEASSRFDDQKAMFESENARLRDETERLSEMSKLHQADLRAQAEIAQRAQQSYEEELVKHAEAAKLLQTVRSEFNELKTQVASFKADSEASKATLHENEEVWGETRARYEQEITELKNRREDVVSQNNRLHQQLETVSAQITALKQTRPSSTETEPTSTGTIGDTGVREEIVNWLKKEKEIVEVQLELSKQEAKRYKQQLDRAQNQLDETTEKLSFERQSQTDRELTAMSHGKLMESINQLNLFRESNANLRDEAKKAQTQVVDRTKKVEELTSQIEPLRTRVRELENEVENKDGDIKLLQEDNDRWQKRANDILSKYDRVDPAELEGLRQQVESLTSERDTLLQEKESMESSVDDIDARVKQAQDELNTAWEKRKENLIESAKSKARQQNQVIQEKQSSLDAAIKDLEDARSELETVKTQLAGNVTAPVADVAMGDAPSGDDSGAADLQRHIGEEQARAAVLEAEVTQLGGQVSELEARVEELKGQLTVAREENERLQTLTGNASQNGHSAAEVEALRVELATAQQELETARAVAPIEGGISQEQIDSLVAQRATELEAEYQQKSAELNETVKQRSDVMKEKLNNKLKELRQKDREELDRQMETLKSEHQAEIEQITVGNAAGAGNAEDGEIPIPNTPAAGVATSPGQFPSTDKDIRDFISKNATAQSIIKRNIGTQIGKVTAEWEKKMAEQEAKLVEQTELHKTALDNAVELEGKRQNVKFTMADRRARDAQAKIDVVAKAATETPQRPVVEVWNEAKTAKAPPPQQGGGQQTPQKPQQPTPVPAAPTGQQSSGVSAPGGAVQLNPTPFGAPSGAAPVPTNPNPFGAPTGAVANSGAQSFGQPSVQPQGTGIPQPGATGLPRPGGGTGPRVLGGIINNAAQQAQPASQVPATQQAQGTGIPRPGQAGRGANQQNRGGAQAGSGIPRGGLGGSVRGRGRGRGLDPGARQFTPTGQPGQNAGAKRPGDGGLGGDNKRTRGS